MSYAPPNPNAEGWAYLSPLRTDRLQPAHLVVGIGADGMVDTACGMKEKRTLYTPDGLPDFYLCRRCKPKAGDRVCEEARGAGTVKETEPSLTEVGLVRVAFDKEPPADCNGGFCPDLAFVDRLEESERK